MLANPKQGQSLPSESRRSGAPDKSRAPRNKTLDSTNPELVRFASHLVTPENGVTPSQMINRVLNVDVFDILDVLPSVSVDLLFLDPPYNIRKRFNSTTFAKRSESEYEGWMRSWFEPLVRTVKPTGSVYICGDWRNSSVIVRVASDFLTIRNRITWEREKGRGAMRNWKNSSEDIWFCTKSDDYTFHADAVKLRRLVRAPYTDANDQPKDWHPTSDGNFRLTYPSNLWSDLTVPFWSMAENTDHPTQKPEKLLAKVILASSDPGDLILDPFLGSGTTAVVAKKLGRRFIGVEIDRQYCLTALKRLEDVDSDSSIQGYSEGAFLERNARPRRSTNSRGNGTRGTDGTARELLATST